MKTIQRTPHTETDNNPSPAADKSAVRQIYTLGLDVDLRYVVTAIQCDQDVIAPARKYTRAQLVAWVQEKVLAGHTVRTVYECCGFGYTLHEQLTAAGAQSLITTPMRLSLERRRKNDRPRGGALLGAAAGPAGRDHRLDGARAAQGGFPKSGTTSWAHVT
jgi:hypothetical protein